MLRVKNKIAGGFVCSVHDDRAEVRYSERQVAANG